MPLALPSSCFTRVLLYQLSLYQGFALQALSTELSEAHAQLALQDVISAAHKSVKPDFCDVLIVDLFDLSHFQNLQLPKTSGRRTLHLHVLTTLQWCCVVWPLGTPGWRILRIIFRPTFDKSDHVTDAIEHNGCHLQRLVLLKASHSRRSDIALDFWIYVEGHQSISPLA